jgi:predicted TIM-barrel fold metal-dependent hydrolase
VETIHELVCRYPNITFVLEHGGGVQIMDVAEAIRHCQNAFLDFSYTAYRYSETRIWEDLEWLARHFDRRITYGSDFPEVPLAEASRLFLRLTDGLDPEKIRNIAGLNLERILGI